MRRSIVLGVLLAIGMLSMAVGAAQQRGRGQQGPPVVEVEKLADNLFVLRGGGGNSAVFVQTNGVTVVDSKNPGWGRPILDKINELTTKPVTTLINTHSHYDHTSGNVEFPPTVDIIVHENTKTNIEKWPAVYGLPPELQPQGNIFKENNGRGLPKRTFKDRMTLGKGNDQVDLYYFGRGHTNGDAWIVFPALRVMHSGDIFANKSLPIVDANAGGSAVEYPETLAKAAMLSSIDRIIPGHSPLLTMADLKEYAAMMREFVTAVREAKKAGRTVDEVANTWKIPEKFKGYNTPPPDRLKPTVQLVFDEN